MQEEKPAPWNIEPLFVGRQPVFNAKKRLQGYELFYRSDEESAGAVFSNPEDATLSVIQASYVSPFLNMKGEKFIMVNFSYEAIVHNAPYALPPQNTIVKITGHTPGGHELEQALAELKKDGYRIAVDGKPGEISRWMDLADIFILDAGVAGEGLQEIDTSDVAVMAKRIEDVETFQKLQEKNISYFQGYFFKRPETLKGANLSTHQIMRLKIFQVLQQEEPDLDELASLLEKEVSLTYRLLRYVNSASFGMLTPIKTIRRALTYVGFKNLRTFLQLCLLRDVTPQSKPSELPFAAALRGRFLELVVFPTKDEWPQPDALFMLGLLSLLDAVFDMPMENVVQDLPIDEDMKKALCREESFYLPWLYLAIAFEKGDWENVDALVSQLGLHPRKVAMSYSWAMGWARDFFEYSL